MSKPKKKDLWDLVGMRQYVQDLRTLNALDLEITIKIPGMQKIAVWLSVVSLALLTLLSLGFLVCAIVPTLHPEMATILGLLSDKFALAWVLIAGFVVGIPLVLLRAYRSRNNGSLPQSSEERSLFTWMLIANYVWTVAATFGNVLLSLWLTGNSTDLRSSVALNNWLQVLGSLAAIPPTMSNTRFSRVTKEEINLKKAEKLAELGFASTVSRWTLLARRLDNVWKSCLPGIIIAGLLMYAWLVYIALSLVPEVSNKYEIPFLILLVSFATTFPGIILGALLNQWLSNRVGPYTQEDGNTWGQAIWLLFLVGTKVTIILGVPTTVLTVLIQWGLPYVNSLGITLILSVLSGWLKIPTGKMQADERARVLNLGKQQSQTKEQA